MIFVVSIIIISIAVTVYFFYRAENLQRQLLTVKREINSKRMENDAVVDALTQVFGQTEAFVQKRLQRIREETEANSLPVLDLDKITPLIQHYNTICNECFKGQGKMSKIVNNLYTESDPDGYKNFKNYIETQDENIKRLWLSNSLQGFLSLVEVLLVEEEKKLRKK